MLSAIAGGQNRYEKRTATTSEGVVICRPLHSRGKSRTLPCTQPHSATLLHPRHLLVDVVGREPGSEPGKELESKPESDLESKPGSKLESELERLYFPPRLTPRLTMSFTP